MKSFTVEEITQIVDGMLTKAQSPEITRIAPPLLCEEDTLALALGEEEISNLSKSKAKAALVPLVASSLIRPEPSVTKFIGGSVMSKTSTVTETSLENSPSASMCQLCRSCKTTS